LHHQAAARLRHGGGRTGAYAIGRRAPTRLDCAGDSARSSDPHSGRGDEQRGHGNRARDPGGARAAGGWSDRVRDCAPVVDAPQGVAAVRDRGWTAGRAWDACRAAGEYGREVSALVRAAGPAPVKKGGSMTALASKPYTGTLTLEWRGDG